ncbi:peptidase [Bacteroidota bacterium]|nr:peptidase [Bacteroidota bacterium]
MMKFLKPMIVLLVSSAALGQQIPAPKEHFGFNIGDNYKLATYAQTEAYFQKLDLVSDRAIMQSIGKTEEGRDQFMMVVTSPANQLKLSSYKEISQKLARAEHLSEADAKKLAADGKAVVWIDGGLHATEVVGAHQLIEIAYQLCSRNDDETKYILDNVIVLIVHANPDGQELVSNWYMRNSDSTKRTTSFLPRLYEKYAGHDNNRDFYMMNLKETQNMGRQLYVEWIPQIMYNHHQTGPQGTVVAGPPFRDPFNYVFDPLVMTSLDAVGAAMINRLIQENKPGYTQRAGSPYSTWYNGGLRTTTYFHNMIGLLTEIIGSPTPSEIPVVPNRLIPSSANPYPITPRKWFFKNSIDYSVSLNYAVLMYAARHRDELLYNIYRMGKNSIERGSKDNWSLSPSKTSLIQEYFQKDQPQRPREENTTPESWGRNIANISKKYFDTVFKNPSHKDARAYILPSNQSDFSTATRFINALIRTGIEIHESTSDFSFNGKTYPAGSYIVQCNQAFRPHVLDMFEPQDHPNDFQYPGGPPVPPYDAAGWTLAFQMGVEFDRITESISGPFKKINIGELQPLKGKISINNEKGGYLINGANNHAFALVNTLMKKGIKVFRISEALNGFAKGSFYVPSSSAAALIVKGQAVDIGADVQSIDKKPADLMAIQPARIALWDTYGGSMPSGWMRWIFEQFKFDYNVIYAQEIDKGDLKNKYDIILFVEGAMPSLNPHARKPIGPKPEDTPEEFKKTIGYLSTESSILALKKFMEDGGTVLTIGNSTNLAYHLKLPVTNALVETVSGNQRNLPNEKFYIPGSVMQVTLDETQSNTWGMKKTADVYFDDSPVFNISPEAQTKGMIKPIAWFASDKTLRSGWAWGQSYLKNGIAAFDAQVGKGKLIAYGPEITFRAQTHGTFKLVFNQLYK